MYIAALLCLTQISTINRTYDKFFYMASRMSEFDRTLFYTKCSDTNVH